MKTQHQAFTEVVKILKNNGILYKHGRVIIPADLHPEDAIAIEDKIEEIEFERDGETCVYQIIDDKLVITEC